MNFTCTKENLMNAVQTVQRAVSPRNSLPILSGFLFESFENKLKITATDLEIGIETIIPIHSSQEGSLVLPAKYITEIVRKLPDSNLIIKTNENFQTTILYGQSEINIIGMSGEDYPALPLPEDSFIVKVKKNNFKKMVKQVVFATASDEPRRIFTGVLLEIKENKICMVATDTHRLAMRKENINNYSTEKTVIIPGKLLSEISKIIDDNDEDLEIKITANHCFFINNETMISTRIIEGQYPNYKQVIPNDYITRIKVNKEDLLATIERAALLSKEGSSVIKLLISNNKVEINSNTPEVGSIHEEVDIEKIGEDIQISFNARYLIDALKNIEEEEIFFDFKGALSPGVIRPTNGDNYLYLVLPIRTL